jgi:TRAP-type uncharacterized transport system substrate-binding protein
MKAKRHLGFTASAKAMLLPLVLCLCSTGIRAEAIVTGGKTGTYFAIGNNLKEIVAPTLEVRDTKGSWANVEEMSRTKGVTLAIVQSDVYAAFVQLRDSRDVPEATRREYGSLLANLRVFMPLYPEEVHFLVRKDDPAEFIHQIKGRPIWMDVEKSGTYLTALNVYAKMFQQRPETVTPFINPTATGDDEGTRRRRSALMALSDPKFYKDYPRVDVMVLVAGQPVGLLEKSVPANLKLLKFDPNHPSSERILREYRRAEILRTSYPALNIAESGVPTIAVDSYLITASFADPKRNQFIKDFADQFCKGFPALRERGHAKWKSLRWQPGAPLPQLAAGWRYSENAIGQLSSCRNSAIGSPGSSQPKACSPQDVVAGLCKPS